MMRTRAAAAAVALAAATAGGCAPALIGAAGSGFGLASVREDRSTADQAEDLQTAMTVENRLGARGERFGDIDAIVNEGRVLLTGAVPDAAAKAEAVEAAGNVQGAREVIDELVVGPPRSLGEAAEDTWIATEARARLIADTQIVGANYSIDVHRGVVHLIGLARSPAELRRAAATVAEVPGVREVVSHVLLLDDPRRKPA